MKLIRKSQYKSIAESWLNNFEEVAKTNRFAKGKRYKIIESERINSLGFNVTDYNIYQV